MAREVHNVTIKLSIFYCR